MNNIVIIKKGTHAPFRLPKFLMGEHRLAANIIFTSSCRYDIGLADQADINKLFGIGYFPFHHKNSVRFGWRYIIDKDVIEIMAYWYVDGERKWEHVCYCSIDKEYMFMLVMNDKGHVLLVYDENTQLGNFTITGVKKTLIAYLLRLYFGGNQVAPHDIKVKMDFL